MPVVDFRPHTLQAYRREEPTYDEFGGQLTGGEGRWETIAPCFCHDNGQGEQIEDNGKLWTYQYNVAYNGELLPLGTKVRCLDGAGDIVGEGVVKRNSRNHCAGFRGRKEIWL